MKRLLSERRKNKPQIVVTNLIDVVLLLVFFFMITSSFATNKEKVPVNIPKATNSLSVEQKDNMTVQIDKNGNIFISGKSISIDELKTNVKNWITNSPERPVLVEADKDVNYGKVIYVLDNMRNSGASNIGLATKQTE